MYTITIKNFYRDGALVKDEQVLYHIPIEEGETENVLTDPTVSRDLGKTGTMEFTIHPNHPYYHAIAQMRTIIRVDYDGDTIFRGRILTIDNTMTGAKRIHCEGDMAFLLDSIQMATKKEKRTSRTLNDYIKDVLSKHNSQMKESGETDKCIYPGYIPGAYPSSITSTQQIANKKAKHGSDSTEQTMNALETLLNDYGGFFQTRYSEADHKTYLDWCRHWFRNDTENKQPVAITQNIIDAQSNSEVDNIFTALIPIGSKEGEDVFITNYKTDIHGKNNRILVPQITKVFSASELKTGYMTKALYEKAVDQYGIIYKTHQFPNADTAAKLWTYACDWIKNNYVGGITSYDLSAFDMHHVDRTVSKYLVGDRIELTIHSDMAELDEYNADDRANTVDRTLLSVKYDLHHPDKNSYTAGIPSDILDREYGTKSTSKSKAGGSGGKGAGGKIGGGNTKKQQEELQQQAREKSLNQLAWRLVWDEERNNEAYEQYRKKMKVEAITPVVQTSQVVVKEVLSDPDIDTMGEVMEHTAMVINGKKKSVETRMTMSNPGWKALMNIPSFARPLVELDDAFEEATSTMALNASKKALELKGKNPSTINGVLDNITKLGITEDTDPETASALISGITGGMGIPNTVGKFGTTKDSSGNEAGLLELGKEALTNIGMDAAGNNGKGTANVGKESESGGWLIRMNEPLKWKDDEGVTHTVPNGTVDAKDYALLKEASGNPIPSFSTQVGVFKDAIAENVRAIKLKADQAEVTSLKARVADIEQLTADYATIKSIVSGQIGSLTVSAFQVNCTSFNFRGFKSSAMAFVKAIDGTTVMVMRFAASS